MIFRVNDSAATADHRWLARFAKLVVFATFVLIFIGGHTTTSGAGMAFPDWPLSHGSLNPNGWWLDIMQRLEHGHRLMAETVGLLVGILCAWIWQSRWALPVAAIVSVVLVVVAKLNGVSREIVAHIGLWSSAVVFTIMVLATSARRDHAHPATVRWLAIGAFFGVCAQAVLGGLRVTIESGGDPVLATAFRIVHGCFAQLELSFLVAVAAMLSPVWPTIEWTPQLRGTARLGWFTAALVYLQLVVGASMRHLGAGLAIPTFPEATADGKWMPAVHNTLIDLNFTHTRAGAAIVGLFVLALALRAFGNAGANVRILRPAALLVALVVGQITLGIHVVWTQKQAPLLTTLHVVNGAALLATTVLLAIRATRFEEPLQIPVPTEPPRAEVQG